MFGTTQKIHKISSAIYFLTGFFDDKEPLKWKLRSLALDLISDSIKDKLNITREVRSLFSMAKTAGLIAEANYHILVGELSKFEKENEDPLHELFFKPEKIEERALSAPESREEVKDRIPESPVSPAPRREVLEDEPKEPKSLREFGAVSVKKNSRQSTIISLLKRKKEIMIKDVAPLISDCSEKTIQRELLAMVEAGILRKIGEKRWSRYTLA
jgi:hypothetical protein